MSREGMALGSGSGLHRLAVVTAGGTFVLLFLGGLVTSTGSGLAVPDWPVSFGLTHGGSSADARRLLFVSLVHLPVVLAIMALDKLAS